MANVIITGGGIIGLCSAYYLNKEGHAVTIIERGNITDGCSFGNMGFISPSHFIPLASPGIISEGLKYMLSSSSPFYIKPRLNMPLMQWAWHFLKNSKITTSKRNSLPLHQLLQLSRGLINDLCTDLGDTFELEEKGCLMMCHHPETFEHELLVADEAEKLGLHIDRLDGKQVQQLESAVEVNVAGAVLFKDDCHFHPGRLMLQLKEYLKNKGVEFRLNTIVSGFEKSNDSINAVITDKGKFNCDSVVIAAGSWLPNLAELLGVKILLQPGKGYSYTYSDVENNISYPAILVDGRCAISPWKHMLRIGGTMEFSGINNKVLVKRMQGIYDSVKLFYPGLKIPFPPADKIWNGLRPVSPDGLPYVSGTEKFDNVIFAGGHAMLGISMGTGTGKLVSQLISNKKTEIDISAFNINRFR